MKDLVDQTIPMERIAIIGMAGRFPGADNLNALWDNLCGGVESITYFNDEALDPGIDTLIKNKPNYVKARGVIRDADRFDAGFFGISPREAEVMDPQQRIFLETSWEALENAGYNPEAYGGLIGVFGGTGFNSYYGNYVLKREDLWEILGQHQLELANSPDYMTTRVSYKLNLRGPSINLFTGCSLSLVAVCQAFDNLLSYQSDLALAGGIYIPCPQNTGYLYQEGEMSSPDGHTRPFDDRARGTVFSSGVGIVVLKRLSEALRDNDHIWAVIRGCGLNNDGSKKVSFTAPNIDGQAAVIALAQANAEVGPEEISFVETHGTGTRLGDPIEIAALTQAFRAKTEKKAFCAIGSLKANIGHLDAAAGVAGLIKTALSLYYKKIPPLINHEIPNKEIDIPNSPFYVNTRLMEWKADIFPRRAAVSSFGVGGTNAHVILEEAPEREWTGPSRPSHLLLLSARSPSALEAASRNLSRCLKENPGLSLADAAYTLQEGRKRFKHRLALVCRSIEEAAAELINNPKAVKPIGAGPEATDPPVAFLFTGQGSQYVNMGRGLYENEAVYRETVDACAKSLQPLLSLDLRDIIYPRVGQEEAAAERLNQTALTQPALFVIEYALARLWGHWGIRPSAMVGHSIGEYTAACLSGVFSLEVALNLVAARGRLMQEQPSGVMLAVMASEERVSNYLEGLRDELSIAVVNAPELVVVSGDFPGVEKFEAQLGREKVGFRRLITSHAFHSRMMEPAMDRLAEEVSRHLLSPPEIPFLSNVTGSWITADQAVNPRYWADHLRGTVRFSQCLEMLLGNEKKILLEVGPGNTLCTLARQHPQRESALTVLPSVRHPRENRPDFEFLLTALGGLWVAGARPDWAAFHENEQRRRIPLPTYPFERKRFWADLEGGSQPKTSFMNGSILSGEIAIQRRSTSEGRIPPDDELKGGQDISAFETATENKLAQIWDYLLRIPDLKADDNYFELGGSSLMAARMFDHIEEVFGTRLPLALLYEAPTIRQLAEKIGDSTFAASWSPLVEIQKGDASKSPLFFVHAEGGNVLEYRPLASHLGTDRPFYGLQALGLEGDKVIECSIEENASIFIRELRKIQKKGPYFIGGYCLGGLIAYEMVRQLEESNDEIGLLALISTRTPDYLRKSSINFSLPKKGFFHLLERVQLEKDNLSVLDWKNRRLYLRERFLRANHILKLKIESRIHKIKRFIGMTESGMSRDLILQKSIDQSNLAYMNYTPPIIKEKIVLFSVSNQPGYMLNDRTLGWGEIARESLQVYDVKGFHKNITKDPNIKRVAEKLEELLKSGDE